MIDALPAEIRSFNGLETFPVLSYPMNSNDRTKTNAELYPPADPAKRFGLYSLGLVNSLAIPIATDQLAITVDPSQLIRLVRCYRVNFALTNLSQSTTWMVHKLSLDF